MPLNLSCQQHLYQNVQNLDLRYLLNLVQLARQPHFAYGADLVEDDLPFLTLEGTGDAGGMMCQSHTLGKK